MNKKLILIIIIVLAIELSGNGIFSSLSAFLIFYSIKVFMGVRVTEEEEIIGLDIAEHEMESYSGFQIFTVE